MSAEDYIFLSQTQLLPVLFFVIIACMAAPNLRLELLGSFRLTANDLPVKLARRKSEALLSYLALYPQEHPREKLAALFWGDSSDEDARRALRVTLTDLRKALGPTAFVGDRDTLQLDPAFPLTIDAQEFTNLKSSNGGWDATDLRAAQAAVLHYRELLPDLYDDWLEPRREELRSLFFETALALCQYFRTRAEYKTTIELANKILSVDSANEAAHQHLMFCYSALGDRAAAFDQYEIAKRALRDELGVEPARETTTLYNTLRQQTETKSDAARLTNLPRPTTSFVGRTREISDLTARLNGSHAPRVLTLLGPGGSGKTRLAIQLGSQLVSPFPDGVWWIDLSPITDESLLPYQVAKVLGAQEQPQQTILETLRQTLADKKLALILDNCEHLINICADLVAALIADNSQLQVLATSREALNIAGEQVYPVSALRVPNANDVAGLVSQLFQFDALALFVERAQSYVPTFQLTLENAPFVVQICRRLDGIPLALELAAARVKHLTVEQIAARLDDRFNLLTQGHRTVLPRQQTLRALIDWSHDLLNDEEKKLFRRLAVFEGGWTLEAAEYVHGSPVLDLLSRLIDKSLVSMTQEHGAERYGFLETVRLYARERLEQANETQTYSTRHYDYFVEFATRNESGFETRSLELVMLEHDHANLRRALQWAHAEGTPAQHMHLAGLLAQFWYLGEHIYEGLFELERAVARTLSLNPAPASKVGEWLAKGVSGLGTLHWMRNEFALALKFHQQATEWFRIQENQALLASSLNNVAVQFIKLQQLDEARPYLEESLAIYTRLNITSGRLGTLNTLGILEFYTRNIERAREIFHRGLELANQTRHARLALFFTGNLAECAFAQKDWSSAQTYMEQALTQNDLLAIEFVRVQQLLFLAMTRAKQQDLASAQGTTRQALRLAREQGIPSGDFYQGLASMGLIQLWQGATERAALLIRFAEYQLAKIKVQPESFIQQCLAEATLQLNQWDERIYLSIPQTAEKLTDDEAFVLAMAD